MTTTFTYYGHACFSLEHNGKTWLFDPFISGNPKASSIDIDALNPDYILLSHGHADHVLDAVRIAKNSGAKVVASFEVHEWLHKQGVENTHPMNIGGEWDFGDGKVKCVVAHHSSVLPDGTYAGNPMGFILWLGDKSFYYAGDTSLTMDMQLIPRWASIHTAILPIGNNFTMGIEDAAIAATFVGAKSVIGVHFDTFGYIQVNHAHANDVFVDENVDLWLPQIGDSKSLI